MRESEAKKLKIGDRVEFRLDDHHEDNGSFGTVTDRDYARFMVKWDDGVQCSYPHVLAMAIHRTQGPAGSRGQVGWMGGEGP